MTAQRKKVTVPPLTDMPLPAQGSAFTVVYASQLAFGIGIDDGSIQEYAQGLGYDGRGLDQFTKLVIRNLSTTNPLTVEIFVGDAQIVDGRLNVTSTLLVDQILQPVTVDEIQNEVGISHVTAPVDVNPVTVANPQDLTAPAAYAEIFHVKDSAGVHTVVAPGANTNGVQVLAFTSNSDTVWSPLFVSDTAPASANDFNKPVLHFTHYTASPMEKITIPAGQGLYVGAQTSHAFNVFYKVL